MGMEGNSNVSCWEEESEPVAIEASVLPQSLWTTTAINSSRIMGSSSVNKITTAAEEVAVDLPGR